MSSEKSGPATRTPLRERHKQYTRDLILEALADVIAEDGIHGFSVQQVADRAGVSHRTVYRHFPGREELINEFVLWFNQSMLEYGAVDAVTSADDIAAAVEVNFAVWDQHPVLMSEVAMSYFVTDLRNEDRERRSQAFRTLVSEIAPQADPEDVQRVYMIIRCLGSSLTWTYFREQYGIDGRGAGHAVAWAIETLIRDLKERNVQTAAKE